MSRSKLGLVGLCVVVGLMAFVAASAQAAPEWLVLNSKAETKTATELTATVEIKTEGIKDFLTHLVKLQVEIRCTADNIVGAKLEGGGKVTSGAKAESTGCKTFNATTKTELPECGVKAGGGAIGRIITSALKGQLQTNGKVKIQPVTGTELAKLEFEAGCVLPSPTTVNGTILYEDCEGKFATHLKEHLLTPASGGEMWVGTDTAEHLETSIGGSVLIFLSGPHAGLLWGAIFP